MPVQGWFPRWSPDGTRLTSDMYGVTWQSRWLDNDRTIAHNGVHLVINGVPTNIPAENELTAGAGVWAGWNPFRVRVWNGLEIPNAGSPALNADGQLFYTDDRQAAVKNLIWHGAGPIARGGIAAVRASRQAVVWGTGEIGCVLLPSRARVDAQVVAEEFYPVPVDTPSGPWILSQTHTGFILRPAGQFMGYRFDNGGQAFAPDAVYVGGIIKVVFTNSSGVQTQLPFPLSVARVDLRAPAAPLPVPNPGTPIPNPGIPPKPTEPPPVSTVPNEEAFVLGVAEAHSGLVAKMKQSAETTDLLRKVKGENDPLVREGEIATDELKGKVARVIVFELSKRDANWGLLEKESGAHAHRHDGLKHATDVAFWRETGKVVDILSDYAAGWNNRDGDFQAKERWKAALPEPDGGVVTPEPLPGPAPVPVPEPPVEIEPDLGFLLRDLAATLTEVKERLRSLQAIEEANKTIGQVTYGLIVAIDAQLKRGFKTKYLGNIEPR